MSSRAREISEVVHSQELPRDKIVVSAASEDGHDDPLPIEPRSLPVDSIRAYLKEIGRIPLLSREEELTESRKVQRYLQLLAMPGEQPANPEHDRIVQDGLRAKTHMIQANLRLVVAVAKKYRNRGLDLMDLIQEGSIALERGVEKFDPAKGYRFSTYAHWWIRQGITRAIANQARAIRLPIHITEKLNALKKASRQLSQEKGRTATLEELSAAVNIKPEEIRKLLGQTRHPISLDIKVGQEQETELGELIESDARSPEDQATRTMLQDALDNVLAQLTDREREVIEMRFGLIDSRSKSLAEIGQALNISRERVRQLEVKALRKLRKPEAREQVQDYLEGMG
jgi:RNA polymerase nonessential primary-like sigma factor